MAKIYNFQLKSVKSFEGREGIGFSANLYYKNKKVGTCLDDASGGELDVDLDYKLDSELRKEIYDKCEKYFNDFPKSLFYNTREGKLNEMVEEIYHLKETEEHFKKNLKKGFSMLVELRYTKRNELFDTIKEYIPDTMYLVKDESIIEKIIKDKKPVEYTVYKSLEDFIIEEKDM